MSIVSLVRPEIQALHAYNAAEQMDDTLRLNANESPLINTFGNFRRPLNRYPELRPQRLQAALAEHFACANDQILVARGSSEAIDLIIRTFCRAGQDHILTTAPTFTMYRHYANLQGAGVLEIQTDADRDFAIDVNTILAACNEFTKVIFICSPNNPTGTPLPRADLLRLLNQRGAQSAIVVDEAYIEFGDERSAIELLDNYPNLLVLRTLSKALGMAGARCGVVASGREIIALLSAIQAPYAFATPVVECVEDALHNGQRKLAASVIKQTIAERSRLMLAFAEHDFVSKVWPSEANFILIRVDDAVALMDYFKAHKVLLRHFGDELPNCIRITVGSTVDNDTVLSILNRFARN